MDIKKLQTLVIDALEDVKAQDIKIYDTTHLTSLFDRICIASGTSNRQTKSLAASVRDKVKQNGGDVIGVEGEEIGEWVLVDLGDMVVHIMQPIIRGYYRLEELWGDKEVKLGAAKRVSKRSAEEVEEEADAVVDKKATRVRVDLNQATQTTVDDVKKPVRKPRTSVAAEDTNPKRAPRHKVSNSTEKKIPARKKAIGTTIKVAASKTAVASAKQAAAKRTTAKRKAAV